MNPVFFNYQHFRGYATFFLYILLLLIDVLNFLTIHLLHLSVISDQAIYLMFHICSLRIDGRA